MSLRSKLIDLKHISLNPAVWWLVCEYGCQIIARVTLEAPLFKCVHGGKERESSTVKLRFRNSTVSLDFFEPLKFKSSN